MIVPNLEKFEEEYNRPLNSEEIYKLIQEEIKKVNKELVLYKYIRDFEIRETEFEKTTTKKIKRFMHNVK
jgi:long-chain acyl-CoA synthetase